MSLERQRILFSGRVQGVGFRATTARLATGFAVRGFVRNLPDGTVELVAEAQRDELDRFAEAIRREFRANLCDVSVELASSGHDLPERFEVRR